MLNLPKDRHYRYFEMAYAVALSGPGVQGRFRLAAVLVKNKRIVAAKYNSCKTNPRLLRFYSFPYLHAESNCILSHGLDNCGGGILYVLRVLKDNSIAMSKPCVKCQGLIEHCNIKRVYYTTAEGWSEL